MLGQWVVRKYQRKRLKLSRKKARIVSRLQTKVSAQGRSSFKSKLILWALRILAPSYRLLPLVTYSDSSKPVATLAPSTGYVTEAPREIGSAPERLAGELPAIMARQFSGAEIFPLGSAIVAENRIAVPSLYVGRPDLFITDGEFLLEQNNGMGTVFCRSPTRAETGIMLFGSGVTNWYHWLIEILPAAFLAEGLPGEYENFPLLVPEVCQNIETFRASLALFTSRRSVVTLAPATPVRVDRLLQIDGVASGPMNLAVGKWPVPSDYSQNGVVLGRYRDAILDRLAIKQLPPNRKIFLARSNDRRNYNQPELLEIAARHGFEAVYPEKLSFRDQVEMFASAEVVVGPSGAAFANMLFCQPNTRGLTWLLPQYNGFCAYSNLAGIVGMHLRYLFVTPHNPINSSYDAYSAAYTLESDRFEASLRAMLSFADEPACAAGATG